VLAGLCGLRQASAEPPAAEAPDFATVVAPLLARRCGACHGPATAESGWRIDDRERALAGGDSGLPGIVAGKPEASEIVRRITTDDAEARMPADADPLPAEERAILASWVAAGAPWPDDVATLPPSLFPDTREASTHWAFQPIVRPPLPEIAGVANPIDAFIAEALAAQGLAIQPEASPTTLLRRVMFDLVGLPPNPADVQAFTADVAARGTDAAVANLVDRLLASHGFGERWARHWLDAVRFAESNGFEMNQARPNAWRYRDWVIESLNADLPYDAFVRAQLAGDSCGADVATGFIVGGAWDQVKSPDPVLTANQRADELHDMVSTTSSAFLGLTVGCARCHDHKFDPIPQTDYYRLKAVFAGVEHGEREVTFPSEPPRQDRRSEIARLLAEAGVGTLRRAVTPRQNIDRFAPTPARFIRFTILETSGAEPCLDELEVFSSDGRNVAHGATPTSSGDFAGNAFHRLAHVNDGLYGNEHSWISNTPGTGWVQLELPAAETIERVVWSRDRSPEPKYADRVTTRYEIALSIDGVDWQPIASDLDRRPFGDSTAAPDDTPAAIPPGSVADPARVAGKISALKRELATLDRGPMAYAGRFTEPGATFRMFRGDPTQPREEILPGPLSRIGSGPWPAGPISAEAARRRALADWIVDPGNRLTARVIVNRLWHHHFGTGLVDTPSDFGAGGGRPSHPELLDWLASELIANGWRLKPIHRLIVTSRAWRQRGAPSEAAMAVDAQDRLLWRYPPHRLEAEAIRDAILATSGSLNPQAGGPGFDLFVANANYVKVYETKTEFSADDFRRMIYQSKPRSEIDTFFGAFDCPDAGQIQPKRTSSTTPLQALNLLNGAFLIDQADRFAARVAREAGDAPAERVRRAFLLAFGREATEAEIAAATTLVADHGLPALCRALYNANEFLSVR
jgi:mono/diheme cytochrome c family protein